VGGQTLASLPILLASAWFALSATADLSAGMKLVLLLVSVCTRIGDMSVTPLSIEFAKGNENAAGAQMQRIVGLSGGVGVCAALAIVCVNPGFISWWMLGKVSWAWHANLSGALWVAILSVSQCLYGYAVISRQMGLIRWALLSECVIYLGLAGILHSRAGPACLLWAKPVAALMIGTAIAWRIKRHTRFDTSRILPGVLRQGLVLALLIVPCLYFSAMTARWSGHLFLAFVINCAGACVAIGLALPFLFPRDVKEELVESVRKLIARFKSRHRPDPRGGH
jgi:hypothetical protein